MALKRNSRGASASSADAPARLQYLWLALFLLSFTAIEFFIGGTRLVFSLPTYGLLAVLSVLTAWGVWRKTDGRADWLCLLSTTFFFGYVIIRALTSPVEYLARSDLFMVLAALIVYFLFAFHITDPKARLWLIIALLTLGVIHTGIGGLQYLRGVRFPLFTFLKPAEYGLRATGFYICPNHLAGFLEIAGLLGLSAVCWSRWKILSRLVACYGALMCFVGLALTASRAGFFSAFVGLVAFALFSLRVLHRDAINTRKWVLIPCLVLLLAGLVAAGIRFTGTQVPLSLRWKTVVTSAQDRGAMWQSAIDQFESAPIMGTGSGTFLYQERLFRGPQRFMDAVYVHNDYLHLLAEFGVVGFVGLGFFLVAHLRRGLRALRSLIGDRLAQSGRLQSNTLALTIGALCAVITYMVHSFFDFNLHIPANALLLAAIFGLLANPGVASEEAPRTRWSLEHALRLATPALGLWLAIKALPTLPAEYFGERGRQVLVAAIQSPNPISQRLAIEFATRALSYDSKNPYIHLYLGQALSETGQTAASPEEAAALFERATAAFEKGLALYPQDRELLLGAATSLDARKRFAEAEPFYRRAIEWNPNSARVRALYATHLHAAKKWDDAETEYKKSLALRWTLSAHEGLQKLASHRQAAASAPTEAPK